MEWNEKTIRQAIELIKEHGAVTDAAQDLGTTSSALRSAFSRHGRPAPSTFIEGRSGASRSPDGDVLDTVDESNGVEMTEDGYNIVANGHLYQMSKRCAEDAVVLYSSEGGLGHPKSEVVRRLYELGHDVEGLTQKHLKLFYDKIGQTKRSHPEVPHQGEEDALEVFKKMRSRRDIIKDQVAITRERKYYQDKAKKTEKELEQLKELFTKLDEANHYERVLTTIYPKSRAKVKESGIFIPVADMHGGKDIKPDRFQRPKNIFNKKVLGKRVGQIVRHISDIDFRGVDRVHVSFLGDMFEGLLANMRPGQFNVIDAVGFEQYSIVRDALSDIIDAVITSSDLGSAVESPHITIVGQGGNHDRATADKRWESEYLMNAMLMDVLNERFRQNDRVEISHAGPVASLIFCGVNFITRHGHKNSPDRYNKAVGMIQDYCRENVTPQMRKVLVYGHKHNLKILSGENWRSFGLSSICGSDNYARDNIGRASTADFFYLKIEDGVEKMIGPFILE